MGPQCGTLLAIGILRWLLNVQKICGPTEFESVYKKVALAQSAVTGAKLKEHLKRYNRFSSQDSDLGPPEYKTRA